MFDRNICKIIEETATDRLEITRFIYESNQDTMTIKTNVGTNRIILIKQGNGRLNIDMENICFETGSLIFVFKGEKIWVEPGDDCEYMYIDFSGSRSESLFSRFCINRANRVFKGYDGLIPMWHDSLCRSNEINIDLASESILLYTFSRLSADVGKQSGLIDRILKISEENFTNRGLSLSSLAETLSYNSKYISHVFKQKMGIGYSEYLRNLRIKYSVSLLEHGIDSIKNVAFLSGFSDPLYFSSVFTKTLGVSPKEYKKQMTNNCE